MSTYTSPVSHLLNLGRPSTENNWSDYSQYGISLAHVPELIRLMQDEELSLGDPDSPEVYAHVHAWRALGQLRAEAAIEPLLDLLAEQENDELWSDWVTEELPGVLGAIGPVALPPTAACLAKRSPGQWEPTYYALSLTEIAKRHPETRTEVIGHLSAFLETAAENDPGANGSIIADLLDLKAAEAWPAIEKAFSTDNVETWVAGAAEDVKWELGLGPKPRVVEPPSRKSLLKPRFSSVSSDGRTAKERAEARARRKKAEKRKQKRKP